MILAELSDRLISSRSRIAGFMNAYDVGNIEGQESGLQMAIEIVEKYVRSKN